MINTSIFSKGLYSSWCYNDTYQTLFDCGEGCATHLANALPGVENVFLGHDHGDHTLGLPSLIKPMNVYYPADNRLMESLLQFIDARYNNGWLRYRLNFIPIQAGFEMEIGKNTFLRAFNMKHQKDQTTLGYVIYTIRTRLKSEYKDLGSSIGQMIKSGKVRSEDISEKFRANLFAYCLDAYAIPDADQIKGCDDVIMDCTFVNSKDRTDMTHFTLDEAVDLCKNLGVKKMYAAHFSPRYDFNQTVKDRPEVQFINPYIVNKI